jgi:hypothetical protein
LDRLLTPPGDEEDVDYVSEHSRHHLMPVEEDPPEKDDQAITGAGENNADEAIRQGQSDTRYLHDQC